ncbi:MAG: hypothetical protein ACRDFY_03600 [Candidatus Limnocylindria bacterium]
MRRALVAALLLAACATPVGAERSGCGAEWQDAEAVAAVPPGTEEQSLPIECMHQIANRRVRVGFVLPAGPSCHVLSRVGLVESADAVSITLFGAVDDDPNVGACLDEGRMVVTEIDVAAPIDDRVLLDGSGAE